MVAQTSHRVLVLGASGLIGRFLTDDLRRRGFIVTGVARSLSPAQRHTSDDVEMPIMTIGSTALAFLITDRDVDLVVNCLGVLQDGPGSDTRAVHRDFVVRLIDALAKSDRPIGLVHMSIPGDDETDKTSFSRTKREAEQLIAASGLRYAILRPGFVVAPAAYGGSAMLRSLAAFPIALPQVIARTPFQPVSVGDIVATVAWLAEHGVPRPGVMWDLMQPEPTTLGGVIGEFSASFGASRMPRLPIPGFLIDLGAKLGDAVSWLGWMPPMRTTAITELRRGVRGDPSSWMVATGIAPTTLRETIGSAAASVQDKWFARLFLIKWLIIASLGLFWIASGFIALFVSYDAGRICSPRKRFPRGLLRR